MYIEINGMVIGERNFSEHNKYITLMTERGKLEVLCRNVRRAGSKLLPVTKMFCYSHYMIYRKKDQYSLNDGSVINNFFSITDDIEKYALSCYFAEICNILLNEQEHADALRLILYSLHAIAQGKKDQMLVKSTYEIKLMCLCGCMPNFSSCAGCLVSDSLEECEFCIDSGIIYCPDCVKRLGITDKIAISKGVYDAIRYIIDSSIERLFSFSLGEGSAKCLYNVCQTYILNHVGYKPKTLDFYDRLF